MDTKSILNKLNPEDNKEDNKEKEQTNQINISTEKSTISENKTNESKEKENIPNQPLISKESNIKTKTEACKIKFIHKEKIYFTFKDYTLTIDIPEDFDENSKIIKIAVESEIGKPDFKYFIEK